jgi:hypothetical protein
VKAQFGFLSVAGGDGDVVDAHHVALGLTTVAGPYRAVISKGASEEPTCISTNERSSEDRRVSDVGVKPTTKLRPFVQSRAR